MFYFFNWVMSSSVVFLDPCPTRRPFLPGTTTIGDRQFILWRNWTPSVQNSGTSHHEGPAKSKRINKRSIYWTVGPSTSPLPCSQPSKSQMYMPTGKRLVNYNPWAKSTPLFLQIKFHWNRVTCIHLRIVCGCFCAAKEELSSCDRYHLTCRA